MVDTSFNPYLNSAAWSIALQSNGRILQMKDGRYKMQPLKLPMKVETLCKRKQIRLVIINLKILQQE